MARVELDVAPGDLCWPIASGVDLCATTEMSWRLADVPFGRRQGPSLVVGAMPGGRRVLLLVPGGLLGWAFSSMLYKDVLDDL